MALKTTRTVLIHVLKPCVIKITPHAGRRNSITAPDFCEITDRKGRRLDARRKKR